MEAFIRSSMSHLRPDLSVERASALYLALTRPEIYQELVDQWGWSPDEYEQWLSRMLHQQLVED